jgi:hypothetical protein
MHLRVPEERGSYRTVTTFDGLKDRNIYLHAAGVVAGMMPWMKLKDLCVILDCSTQRWDFLSCGGSSPVLLSQAYAVFVAGRFPSVN